jgi:MraZ protein
MGESSISPGIRKAPFFGKATHNLDPKKRLTIPAKWRNLVGEEQAVFLIPGVERPCLMLFTAAGLERMMAELEKSAASNPEQADISMALGESGDHLVFDSQGRIRVSDEHLEMVGLSGAVHMVGALNRIELWDEATFTAHRKQAPSSGTAATLLKV